MIISKQDKQKIRFDRKIDFILLSLVCLSAIPLWAQSKSESDFADHTLATDGLLYRLRRAIEIPTNEWIFHDSLRKQYIYDGRQLRTTLYNDNANFTIPSTAEAPLVEARARAFAEVGLIDVSNKLYSALRRMDGRYFSVTADVRQVAKRVPDFEVAGPIVIRDKNTVHIISEDVGVHLQFREADDDRYLLYDEPKSITKNFTGYSLRLFTKQQSFLIFLDKFIDTTSNLNAGSYQMFCDLRRGFDVHRKKKSQFHRSCNDAVCRIEFSQRNLTLGWIETGSVRSGAGFMITLTPTSDAAEVYLRQVHREAMPTFNPQ